MSDFDIMTGRGFESIGYKIAVMQAFEAGEDIELAHRWRKDDGKEVVWGNLQWESNTTPLVGLD